MTCLSEFTKYQASVHSGLIRFVTVGPILLKLKSGTPPKMAIV